MRDLNEFIDNQSRTYKTRETAERAFAKARDSITEADGEKRLWQGSVLIASQRQSGRYVVVILNPSVGEASYWLHHARFAVWGLTEVAPARLR